jgi:hypothetical protein
MASSHAPSLEPVPAHRRGAVKDSQAVRPANMERAELLRATKNRPLASRVSVRTGVAASTAVHGAGRDVKLWRTPSYRTFATASVWSDRTVHSNRGGGKKNFRTHSGGDSPRRSRPAPVRLARAPEPAPGSEKTDPGGSFFLARSRDNGDWRSAGSNAGPLRDRLSRSNGSADAEPETTDRNP